MGTHREASGLDYVTSPIALLEQAVTTAGSLRLLGFSKHTIVFELRRQYGCEKADAAAIVREAAVRDLRPTTRRCRTRNG